MPGTRDGARPPASPASGGPTLVASKLAPPRFADVRIRPGLLEKVAQGGQRRLLLVSAPAGYGKSTLIAEAAERLGWTTAWYKLDVLDHDPIVLVASLTEAIRRRVAGFGDVVTERLSNSREVPITVPELLALFVHELEDEVKLTLHLVLDDYHEASASLELNKALDFLLANVPAHIHVVLVTRFEPSFSTAKLRLEDEIAELRYEDLRLDAGQIESVFKSRAGAEISLATATRLEELTDGWPVSVVLACKALQWSGLPSIEVALSDPRLKNDVFSYLAEQVFRREGDEARAFLKRTSCLDYVTAILANEITGGDHAERILDYLEKNQVFTFADAARTTYRYHPLFRDYLRQKCAQENGAREFHDLQLKTAGVMERAGDTGVAVEIYLSANEPALALDCLAGAGESALENSTLDGMRSWLTRLPADLRRGSVWALLLAGQVNLREGRFDEAIAVFRAAESSFARTRDRWGRYHAASAIESALFWKGDTVGAAAECRRAIGYAPDKANNAHSLISLGAALMDAARWGECESLWAQAEDLLDGGNPRESVRIDCLRSYAKSLQGSMKTAAEEARAVLARVRELGPKSLEASFLNALGGIEMHLGRYDEAESACVESIDVSGKYGFHHFDPMTKDSLGQVMIAIGHFENGYRLLEESAASLEAAGDHALLALTHSHRGTAWRRQNSLERALAHYAIACELAAERPLYELMCLANLRFTEGLAESSDAPIAELQDVASQARRRGLLSVALKCDFFAALLRYLFGDRHRGLTDLAVTIERQAELGHLHFLSRELRIRETLCEDLLEASSESLRNVVIDLLSIHPPDLTALLRLLSLREEIAACVLERAASRLPQDASATLTRKAKRHSATRVRRLAQKIALMTPNEPGKDLVELGELTNREAQVLAMMADGMRNDEIAQALFLAPSTVKTHVNRVFFKLGVSDRVQAVLRYRASTTASH